MLASIAGYYRRVTTNACPMSHAVGAVMATTVAGSALELVRGTGPRALALAVARCCCASPAALAYRRVVPNAVRLGARADAPETQSALARAICRDHLACLAMMLAVVAAQKPWVNWPAQPNPPGPGPAAATLR